MYSNKENLTHDLKRELLKALSIIDLAESDDSLLHESSKEMSDFNTALKRAADLSRELIRLKTVESSQARVRGGTC